MAESGWFNTPLSKLFRAPALVGTLTMSLVLAACGAPADNQPSASAGRSDAASAAPSPSEGGMEPVSGGTLTIATSQEVLTLDIPNYLSTQDIMTGAITLETLIVSDESGNLSPKLAVEWEQVDDVTYTFQLREGVTFQDGRPFNSEAVKVFYERAKTALKSQRWYGQIDTIETNGDYEVTFKLADPYSPFLVNLSYATGGIQSPASIEEFGDEGLARNPVGTGPFQLADWTGTKITFERYDDYWGDPAYLDEIVLDYIPDESTRLAALEAGEVDVVQNPPVHLTTSIEENPDLQTFQGPRAQNYILALNHQNEIFQDIRVRQAIAMAIDKSQLIDGISEGLPREAAGFVPPEVVELQTAGIEYDPEGAMALLEEAGYPDGFSIELWGPVGVVPNDVEMVENMQAQLAEVGIDAELVVVEYAAYADALNRHEHGLSGLAWAHTTTPDSWFRGVFHSESLSNWSAYSNSEVDELIEAAAQAPSFEEATEIWAELDQMLVDDVAGVPIYWSTYVWAAKAAVHDFGYHPLGVLFLDRTWIEQ